MVHQYYEVFVIDEDGETRLIGCSGHPQDLAISIIQADEKFPTPWAEYTIALVEEKDVQTNSSLH